ncbi:hypothetical protein F0562_010106 [Nyssa sinensis]|uniref:Uncharacterized protein n=1 Tax=Nyssa sinensis TaxID=561372 RepID=A0A5J4ZXX6_9ASTE|nr:hypothetical protein F0562_010106 [Nyssa sinensis]
MQWAGEDWGIPPTEKIFSCHTIGDKAMKIEENTLLGDLKGGFPPPSATEVKIKISKKQLEDLLSRMDVQGLSVQQVLAQLVNGETHQRAWRPALQSIPEGFQIVISSQFSRLFHAPNHFTLAKGRPL